MSYRLVTQDASKCPNAHESSTSGEVLKLFDTSKASVIKVAGKDKGVDEARRELAARFSRRGTREPAGTGGN